MEKRMSGLLRKCKSLGLPKLGRSSSYRSSRSMPTRDQQEGEDGRWPAMRGKGGGGGGEVAMVFVGSSRRPYAISAKHLDHPLLSSLLEMPKGVGGEIAVKCEVVLFDHLLWMLENANLDIVAGDESMEELVGLYAY